MNLDKRQTESDIELIMFKRFICENDKREPQTECMVPIGFTNNLYVFVSIWVFEI